ncbi:unnamed protein product [Boreogadus saida]
MGIFLPCVTTPSLSSVCDFEQNLCGWLPDPRSGVTWSLRTASGAHGHGGHGNVEAELDNTAPTYPSSSAPLQTSGNYTQRGPGGHTGAACRPADAPRIGARDGPASAALYTRLQGEALGETGVRVVDEGQRRRGGTPIWQLKGEQGPTEGGTHLLNPDPRA